MDSATMIVRNQLQTGARFKTKTVKRDNPITFIGITRTSIALWPIRSATRDQWGVEKAITTDAVALSAPASAYESLTATTMKMSASESIEMGIRAMTPGMENLRAPGVLIKVLYPENIGKSLSRS
jgi:hypothetical protein